MSQLVWHNQQKYGWKIIHTEKVWPRRSDITGKLDQAWMITWETWWLMQSWSSLTRFGQLNSLKLSSMPLSWSISTPSSYLLCLILQRSVLRNIPNFCFPILVIFGLSLPEFHEPPITFWKEYLKQEKKDFEQMF